MIEKNNVKNTFLSRRLTTVRVSWFVKKKTEKGVCFLKYKSSRIILMQIIY